VSAKVEWTYWPQYRRYVLTSTTPRRLGEDLVEQVALSPSQARRFAKMVFSHEDDCMPANRAAAERPVKTEAAA